MSKQPTWGQIINHLNAQTESINKQNDIEDRQNQRKYSNNCSSPWPTSLVLSGYHIMWASVPMLIGFIPISFFSLLMGKDEGKEVCLFLFLFLLYWLLFGFLYYKIGKKWQKKYYVDNSNNLGKKREELNDRYEKANYLMIIWVALLLVVTFLIAFPIIRFGL